MSEFAKRVNSGRARLARPSAPCSFVRAFSSGTRGYSHVKSSTEGLDRSVAADTSSAWPQEQYRLPRDMWGPPSSEETAIAGGYRFTYEH